MIGLGWVGLELWLDLAGNEIWLGLEICFGWVVGHLVGK